MPLDLINVRNLSVAFSLRDHIVHALDDVSFDIMEGELLTVLGPSGCGKSTLLRSIAGLLKTTKGEILYKGRPLDGPQREIAVIFQDPVLLPWRTVIGNMMLPVEVLGLDKKSCLTRASELLGIVRLTGFERAYPWELSGGMRQRAAIARALMSDPSIMLMDEPFGDLDMVTREQMNMELLRICKETEKTVFFITHSLTEAILLGNRTVIMTERPGRVKTVINIALQDRNRDAVYSQRFGDYVKKIEKEMESWSTL